MRLASEAVTWIAFVYFVAILTTVRGAATSQTDISQLKVLWEALRGEFWNYGTLNSGVDALSYDGTLGTVKWSFDTDNNGVFLKDPCDSAPNSNVLPQQHFAGLICKQNGNVYTVDTLVLRSASIYGGSVPADVTISGLKHLDLSHNGLTGGVPATGNIYRGLRTLILAGNQVSACACVCLCVCVHVKGTSMYCLLTPSTTLRPPPLVAGWEHPAPRHSESWGAGSHGQRTKRLTADVQIPCCNGADQPVLPVFGQEPPDGAYS